MKRYFGLFCTCVFALVLLVEVAGLPWISSFSLDIEKTVVLEVEELGVESNVLTASLDLHRFVSAEFTCLLGTQVEDAKSEHYAHQTPQLALDKTPVFIQIHSLRI